MFQITLFAHSIVKVLIHGFEPCRIFALEEAPILPTESLHIYESASVSTKTSDETERLPEEGKTAIDNAVAGHGRGVNYQYEIVSARQVEDVLPLALETTPDEAWCVVIDPPAENAAFEGTSTKIDRILVTRRSNSWEAFYMQISPINREVWLQVGCNNWDDGF